MNPQNDNLNELRGQIDRIDRELIRLLGERMQTAAAIAEVKRASGRAVYDPVREREKLESAAAIAGEEFGGYTKRVFSVLMEVSRDYQKSLLASPAPLYDAIREARANEPFPETASAACTGTVGSRFAVKKLFRSPKPIYCRTFEEVLSAVRSGKARFGVLPVENSVSGPVSKVWSLLEPDSEQSFYAVRAVWLRAAGASPECASPCDPEDGAANIQSADREWTRFLCVSRKPEIFPGADRTSVMLTLPDEPGALYRVLSRFHAAGINLSSVRSRPVEGKDSEFRFVLDFEAPADSPKFASLMQSLPGECGEFHWLGSYREIR